MRRQIGSASLLAFWIVVAFAPQAFAGPKAEKSVPAVLANAPGAQLPVPTFESLGERQGALRNAAWDPIHFPPLIATAKDSDCLRCHGEVLEPSVRKASPAGGASVEVLAWYQTLDTYSGNQETFHRRHMATPLAQRVMNLSCTTCHQGNEPRDEMGATPPAKEYPYTLRKMVDPNTCLMCHGQMKTEVMGIPQSWPVMRAAFGDSCLTCHAAIRTTRHNVNFLKPAEIEAAGKESSDTCYGCHGGRAWYQTSYPYPRHGWSGMAPVVPDWAKDRPTESLDRFRVSANTNSK